MKFSQLIFFLLLLIGQNLWAQTGTLDSSFGNPTTSTSTAGSTSGLTDEQAREAATFLHSGVREAAMKKGCTSLDKCDPNAVNNGVLLGSGLGATLENNIGKLYVGIFGASSFLTGGGGPQNKLRTTTPVEAPAANTANAAGATTGAPQATTPEKTTTTDYCMYGAMGWEMIAGAMQMGAQKQATQDTAALNDPQLSALVNLKEAHAARKKTSLYQSTAYGAVTACYMAQAVMPPRPAMDWKYITKMSSAAAISALYLLKSKKHADAVKKVQLVIDSLPKAGDCNPWTGTSCFCKESTSKNLYPNQYQQVCVLNAGNPAGGKRDLACGVLRNGLMTLDEACACKANNSCFTTTIRGFNPQFSQGANLMALGNEGFDLLNKGDMDDATLENYSTETAALATRVLGKIDTSKVPKVNLNDEQKAIAASLDDIMPASIAGVIAASPSGTPNAGGLMNGATASALENLPTSMKSRIEAAEVNANYRQSGSSNNTNAVAAEEAFTLPQMGQAPANDHNEVVSFAERAVDRASDVSSNPDTPIWDIISMRMKKSGWGKLQPEPAKK